MKKGLPQLNLNGVGPTYITSNNAYGKKNLYGAQKQKQPSNNYNLNSNQRHRGGYGKDSHAQGTSRNPYTAQKPSYGSRRHQGHERAGRVYKGYGHNQNAYGKDENRQQRHRRRERRSNKNSSSTQQSNGGQWAMNLGMANQKNVVQTERIDRSQGQSIHKVTQHRNIPCLSHTRMYQT